MIIYLLEFFRMEMSDPEIDNNLDDSSTLQNVPQNQTTEPVLSDHMGDLPTTMRVDPNIHKRMKKGMLLLHLPFYRNMKELRPRYHQFMKKISNVFQILIRVQGRIQLS